MNILRAAFRLVARVTHYHDRARRFFYHVVLSDKYCPHCGGSLRMIREGQCRCQQCDDTFDPTVAFQHCPDCGGRVKLVVRRYRCVHCITEVPSRFLFDGLVYDAQYYRQKMAASRRRKKQQRERVKQMLAESRFPPLGQSPIDLDAVPGLTEALNGLVGGLPDVAFDAGRSQFDLPAYRRHILAHLNDPPVEFDEIPALDDNPRHDRIWRFVTLIFMAHAGELHLWQRGPTILIDHETHAEGPGLPGEAQGLDEFEAAYGGASTW